ncbi:Cytoplasmic tRNA 2-thiolation protein 1 [Eufriesea mexicana]|nr:Cytoplasmic tRNA 2-thiolation protein 1 [Eufriesea mexicana]
MPISCSRKCGQNAILKRPKTGHALCKECFFFAFESEIHNTIIQGKLFRSGDKVAIGASGGKDSTVLAYVLKTLNERYQYGIELFLLSIDEGITGYRDDSLKTVQQNKDDYGLPLKILSYKELYGWTMDEIVSEIGRKNNCTFCGVFRRQALDRGAALLAVDCIATGHNADDIAETVLMNILRGDIARLQRCTSIITSKYIGTGHADTTKFEWLVNQHRDSCSSYMGHYDLLNFFAIAENEAKARVRFNLMEKMLQPCGPPPEKPED